MALYRYIVDIAWAGSGSPGVNVWHMRTPTTDFIDAEVQEMVDALATFYGAVRQFSPGSVTFTGRGEVVKDFNESPTFEAVTGFSLAGNSSTAGYAPLATQLVVGWRTQSATRRGRGRTFLGPLSQGTMEANGTPTAGVVSSLGTAAQNLVDASSGFDNGAICVWSERDQVARDITGYKVRDTFAVLRSRRD